MGRDLCHPAGEPRKPHLRVHFDRRLKLEFHGLKTYEVMESVLKNMRIHEPQCFSMYAAWKSGSPDSLGVQSQGVVHRVNPDSLGLLGPDFADEFAAP